MDFLGLSSVGLRETSPRRCFPGVLNVVLNYCETFLTVSPRFESGIYFTSIRMFGKRTEREKYVP